MLRAYSYVQDRRGRPLQCYRTLRAAADLSPLEADLWAGLLDQIDDLRSEEARLAAITAAGAPQDTAVHEESVEEQLRDVRAAIATEGEVRGRMRELAFEALLPTEDVPLRKQLGMLDSLVQAATRRGERQ